MLLPEEEQVCFSARLKVINNSQLRGKAVVGSWSLPKGTYQCRLLISMELSRALVLHPTCPGTGAGHALWGCEQGIGQGDIPRPLQTHLLLFGK